jgi:hypothetical protein
MVKKRSITRPALGAAGLLAGLLAVFSAMPLQAQVPSAYNGYVIITSNAIANNCSMSLQNFIHMKELEGHTVKVATESDFGGLTGQAPNGTAEKIRKWLQDNRDPLQIRYVLLIGDPDPDDPLALPDDYPRPWSQPPNTPEKTGDIPMKMCFPLFHDDHCRESPTDYFYADLSGNWDLDGDGIFGENTSRTNPRSPDNKIDPEHFTATWTGQIDITESARYKFMTFSDDGMRVYLDGSSTPILDDWGNHPPTLKETDFMVIPTGKHDIKVEYHQEGGDAIARFYWETEAPAGGSQAIGHWTTVPASSLYHLDPATGNYVSGGLLGVYDVPGTSKHYSDIGDVNRNWLTGDMGPGGRDQQADVIVGRIPVYDEEGDYSILDSILAKIIDYETDPGDIGWRRSVLLPNKNTYGDGPTYKPGEAIKHKIADPALFRSFRIYWDNFAPTGPTPDLWPTGPDSAKSKEFDGLVVNEWKNVPYGMMIAFSHGGPFDSVLGASDALVLNDAYPSFIFLGACDTAWPEVPLNLTYSLLKSGGITAIGSSRESYMGWFLDPLPNPASGSYECMEYEYAKAIVGDTLNPALSAGEALYAVKGMIGTLNPADFGSNLMDYNLYGDPDCYLLKVYPNERPVANVAGPLYAKEGDSITLDGGSSYDPEGDSLLYRWDTNDDGYWDTDWSYNSLKPVTFFTPGVHTVRMQARDSLGKTREVSHSASYSNVSPVVEAGADKTINEGDTFSFSGSFTDPGLETFEYAISFGDAPGVTTGAALPGVPFTASHRYGSSGTYPVSLSVTDNYGGTGSDAMTVTVKNVAPIAEAGSDMTVLARTTAYFNGSWIDPGNDVTSVEWNFNDGTPKVSGTLNPTHAFATKGTYTVTLTVKDADGATGTDSLKVKVTETPLSFENPSQPWTRGSTNFTIGTDTTLKTEGNSSIKLNGTGEMKLVSPKFKSKDLPYYSNALLLDIYMPSPATNPYWMGTAQIYITSSNPVFNNRMISQVLLNNLPLNQWDSLNFPVSADVYKVFTNPDSDVQLTIVINTNQSAGNPYRIDNLRFSSH